MTTKISTAYGALVIGCWRSLKIAILDTYRPELHYMRGPGPKWQEKHRAGDLRRASAVPRLVV